MVDIVSGTHARFIVSIGRRRRSRHGLGLHLTAPGHPGPSRRPGGSSTSSVTTTSAGAESFLHLEVVRDRAPRSSDELGRDLLRIIGDVEAAVQETPPCRSGGRWPSRRPRLERTRRPSMRRTGRRRPPAAGWLADDHFNFLGYREMELMTAGGRPRAVPQRGGLPLGDSRDPVSQQLRELPPEVCGYLTPEPLAPYQGELVVDRAQAQLRCVKRLGPRVTGWGKRASWRALQFAAGDPRSPPQGARGAPPGRGRAGTATTGGLAELPPRGAVQIDADELYEAATAILDIQDRQRLRLLVRCYCSAGSRPAAAPAGPLTAEHPHPGYLEAAFHGVSTQHAM